MNFEYIKADEHGSDKELQGKNEGKIRVLPKQKIRPAICSNKHLREEMNLETEYREERRSKLKY
ncbi:MAG: hypothetical protein M5E90_02945 [Asgard group archaeon]|nr:hypothetical protein [Asgard group archaeon]